MKKTISFFNIAMVAFLLMLSIYNFSCQKDLCKDVSCLNGGSCIDGTCKCPTGFEATDCSVETRKKYLGDYHGDGNDGNAVVHTDWHFTFSLLGDNALKLAMNVHDSTTTFSYDVPVIVNTNLRDFNIITTTDSLRSISGNGTISSSAASVTMEVRDSIAHTSNIYFFFSLVK